MYGMEAMQVKNLARCIYKYTPTATCEPIVTCYTKIRMFIFGLNFVYSAKLHHKPYTIIEWNVNT